MNCFYVYKGSGKDSHTEIVSLGAKIGLRHIRKMSIGEKIVELANRGDKPAIKICGDNPKFFQSV